MHEYELMYILHPRLTTDEAQGAIDRVSAMVGERGGEVLSAENWGRRRLAYPIEHNFEGTYVLSTLRLSPEVTARLESALRISEDVIRHLLIRGIIPYEGPVAQDDRARSSRSAASDSPEAVEESVSDAGISDAVSDTGTAGVASDEAATDVASDAEAGEAAPAAPTGDGGGDSEAGVEAEASRAAGDAGSAD